MKLSIIMSSLLFISTAVLAKPSFTLYGAGAYSTYTSTAFVNAPNQSRLGYPGAGLAVEFPMGKRFGLVIDASYFTRKFNTAAFGELTQSQVQGDVLVNFWLAKFIAVGVGGYGAYGFDPIRRTSGTLTHAAYGIRNAEFGLTGSLNIQIPVSSKFAFITGAKYHFGLANIATAANARLQFNDIIFFLGFKFGEMKKK